ncbi:hypothetical protein CHLRE_12g499150v5 [Chlamydomonas reinhardtii]|uniref:Uncharacterized protein n=1 Tax=Chlamydomonas reinhardtii TaxID=3055 RepID=A0A2K3D3C9_CHLRE|nr:uncharacterized protein CHLRE_12g499150v5 [Chlamydomonas reinhardtii]PNW75043.1 hypothetical protein CHLRE_12g499150v5 [Chlamydomonas reinhardtii]
MAEAVPAWVFKLYNLPLSDDEKGQAIAILARMPNAALFFWGNEATSVAAVKHLLRQGDAGAAAGLGVGSAAGAGAAASQGAETAVGAGVAAGQSLGGTADAGYFADLFPSALYCMTFTLYDGVDVAMRLVSHAKANGFRGEVRHVSTSRSDFTLLLKTDDVGKQTLKGFASWLATQVPVRAPGAEASTAFAKAAEADAARVEVTSDPFNPLTRDRELLDMYNEGWLTAVYATTDVRRALEKANTEAERRERPSKSSLGKSRASSSHAE